MKAHKNKDQTFVLLTVFAFLALSPSSRACEVKDERQSLSTMVVSPALNKWAYVTNEGAPEIHAINIDKCQGGLLQITQGVNLPSPADYSGLTFLRKDLPQIVQCNRIEEDKTKNDIQFRSQIEDQLRIAHACTGIEVLGVSGQEVKLLENKQCAIISQDKRNHIILQGDNCVLSVNQSQYRIAPTVLPACLGQLESLTSKAREIDLVISVRTKKDGEPTTPVDEISQKPVRFTVSADVEPKEATSKFRVDVEKMEIRKSSDINLNMGVGELRIMGTPEKGLKSSIRYFIDNSGSSLSNKYRAPFVMKNELYLVKTNEEPQLIGNWYTGSVVSAQWKGMDGEPTFNRLFLGPPYVALSASAKTIQKGDQLVLVSKLENPNVGPRKFAKYLTNLLVIHEKKPISKTSMNFKGDSLAQIPSLDAHAGLSGIQELGDLDQLSTLGKASVRDWSTTWPTTFRNLCVNSHCGKLDDLDETLRIESLYRVEDAQLQVSTRLVRRLQKWNGKTLDSKETTLNKNKIECL